VTAYPFTSFHPNARDIPGSPFGKGDVVIGSDCWIGAGSAILSGVTIGDGAVVAARAVVAKNVPPYAVVAGNPAKVVRFRFGNETIARLLDVRWWNLPRSVVDHLVPLLSSSDLESFLSAAEEAAELEAAASAVASAQESVNSDQPPPDASTNEDTKNLKITSNGPTFSTQEFDRIEVEKANNVLLAALALESDQLEEALGSHHLTSEAAVNVCFAMRSWRCAVTAATKFYRLAEASLNLDPDNSFLVAEVAKSAANLGTAIMSEGIIIENSFRLQRAQRIIQRCLDVLENTVQALWVIVVEDGTERSVFKV
jgi:hypothetical protein